MSQSNQGIYAFLKVTFTLNYPELVFKFSPSAAFLRTGLNRQIHITLNFCAEYSFWCEWALSGVSSRTLLQQDSIAYLTLRV